MRSKVDTLSFGQSSTTTCVNDLAIAFLREIFLAVSHVKNGSDNDVCAVFSSTAEEKTAFIPINSAVKAPADCR